MKLFKRPSLKPLWGFLFIYIIYLTGVWLILAVPAAASETIEFKLAWDANIEEDLDGYEIYFNEGASGSSYKMIGDVFVDELDDPESQDLKIAIWTNLNSKERSQLKAWSQAKEI